MTPISATGDHRSQEYRQPLRRQSRESDRLPGELRPLLQRLRSRLASPSLAALPSVALKNADCIRSVKYGFRSARATSAISGSETNNSNVPFSHASRMRAGGDSLRWRAAIAATSTFASSTTRITLKQQPLALPAVRPAPLVPLYRLVVQAHQPERRRTHR